MKITLILFIAIVSKANNSTCSKIGSELINLTFEMNKEFKKTKSVDTVMKKYKKDLDNKIDELGKIGEKYPECQKELQASASEAQFQLKEIYQEEKKKENKQNKSITKAEVNIEIISHADLKEKLSIGPSLIVGKKYKVTSLYGELYDGLCKPMFHQSGKVLCDDVESLIKNINFDFKTQEARTNFYRNKKNLGCFTFEWTNYDKLKIIDYQVGNCN